MRDWEKSLSDLDSTRRTVTPLLPDSCERVEIGFGEIGISKWSFDYCRMQPCSIRALGDTTLALPELTRLCAARIAGDARLASRIAERRRAIEGRHDALWAKWQDDARKDWDSSPVTLQRFALEIWDVVKTEDWVLSANNLRNLVRRLWDFDKPYRHPGRELGTATQIGISLGVALAHKGTGRVVVDIQPDGDLMFDAGALWVAAKYQIPLLVVMFNNRAYYNDWEHQLRMARHARHRRGQGAYRHGPVRTRAGFRRAGALHGLLGRGPDRESGRHRPGAAACARPREAGQAGAGRRGDAAPVRRLAHRLCGSISSSRLPNSS